MANAVLTRSALAFHSAAVLLDAIKVLTSSRFISAILSACEGCLVAAIIEPDECFAGLLFRHALVDRSECLALSPRHLKLDLNQSRQLRNEKRERPEGRSGGWWADLVKPGIDCGELGGEIGADQGNHRDKHDGDQAGEQSVFDPGDAALVLREGTKGLDHFDS